LYDLQARERVSAWSLPAGPSGYSDAGGVAIDRNFRIFVADAHNHRVRRFNAFGQHLGDLGLAGGESTGQVRDRTGILDRPSAVAVHLDRVYVAMGEQPRRRSVQCFHVDGRALAGLPARGDAAQKWAAPRGIWADDRGVIVADTLRGQLQCFRGDGAFVQELGVGCSLVSARPGHVVRLGSGAILCVDHAQVRSRLVAVRPDGTELDLAQLESLCRDPLAVAVDEQQCVYVLDHDGERVLRLTPDMEMDVVLVHLREHDPDGFGG